MREDSDRIAVEWFGVGRYRAPAPVVDEEPPDTERAPTTERSPPSGAVVDKKVNVRIEE